MFKISITKIVHAEKYLHILWLNAVPSRLGLHAFCTYRVMTHVAYSQGV